MSANLKVHKSRLLLPNKSGALMQVNVRGNSREAIYLPHGEILSGTALGASSNHQELQSIYSLDL